MSSDVGHTILIFTLVVIQGFNSQMALIFQKVANKEFQRDDQFSKCKWVLGFTMYLCSSLTWSGIIPYADLVLLSCSSAINIMQGLVLSVYSLGEKFNYKKDLPAFALIIAGCTLIVLFSNKT